MTIDKVDAYMPLWIGAYLADTQHLTRDEHGGYILLLMAYWRSKAPLVDDDKRLAAICKASAKEWKTLRPTLAEFFKVADGVWRHKRVEAELADAVKRKEKASSKAKAAAGARWGKASEHASGDAPSMLQALLKECPTTSPTPSPSENSVPNGTAGPDGPPPVDKSTPTAEDQAADLRRSLWRQGGEWLVANGLTVSDAKAFMNTLAGTHAAVMAEAIAAAVKTPAPVDAKAFLTGIAQRLAGERAAPVTVPSTEPARTAEYLAQQEAHRQEAAATAAQRAAEVRERFGRTTADSAQPNQPEPVEP